MGGIMVAVGIKELKEKLSGYVDRVRNGESIVVTDRGREVALMVPVSPERRAVRQLMESGRAAWSGGKPQGLSGIRTKGKALSRTILENRR
jgi:prevent-host-death family protein